MKRRPGTWTKRGECQTCRHPEIARINFLLCTGSTRVAIAKKFGLSRDSVERHTRRHISAEYRAACRIGPFRNEHELRRLLSENSASVTENLLSIYQGLSARWLSAHESGSDQTLVLLTKEMLRVLDMRARISRELMPAPSTVINNVVNLPVFIDLQNVLLRTLARSPEARAEVIRAFKEIEAKSPPAIEVAA